MQLLHQQPAQIYNSLLGWHCWGHCGGRRQHWRKPNGHGHCKRWRKGRHGRRLNRDRQHVDGIAVAGRALEVRAPPGDPSTQDSASKTALPAPLPSAVNAHRSRKVRRKLGRSLSNHLVGLRREPQLPEWTFPTGTARAWSPASYPLGWLRAARTPKSLAVSCPARDPCT
jgi:hypothetical protein